ncbi:class I SAM-dependent methyltransferase [Solirubrobacter sp. CPCC 204708]|uniref:class I SAM-dependent methyltransferase n=1 Tax=Solirubrobacter deserti TaxID=2282478 RepID=UPI002AFB24CF|nr:class I SAM-dependent methyltransferase [Solirubrobacter deserti]
MPQAIDLATVKSRQQAMWASGDFGVIAALIHIVAELLVDSADLIAGSRVLDVAGGTGNAAIAAARCGCDVTCTDYVPELLERGRERARAERLNIEFAEADAEALPYGDGEFDAVISTFGAMFAPDQAKAASELVRTTRPGGLIALASWTPEGFLGELFRTTAGHVPPPPGVASPLRWGTEAGITELLGDDVELVSTRRRTFTWRFRRPAEFIYTLREWYGPTVKAFEAVGPAGAAALEHDLIEVVKRAARNRDGAIAVPAEYLEVVAVKR